jgi:hypothetical protein
MASGEQPPTPDSIFQVATGFMASKHLFVAAELGLFEALAEAPATLDTLAARLGVPRRTLRISADAMVALGFLARSGEAYQNSPVAQAFLSGRGQPDMRPFLRFWNRISYPTWLGLEGSLRSGKAVTAGSAPTDEENRILADGIEAINAGGAAALPDAYDFGQHRRVLSLGFWYVSFLFPLLRRHPALSGTIVMAPQWIEKARAALDREGLAARMSVQEGDYLYDELPPGHDAVLAVNVAHHLSPEHNQLLVQRVRERVEPGTKLLIIDFFTDAAHTSPPFAALMAGEFQTISGEGDVYSVDEAKGWLAGGGFRFVDHRVLRGPSSIVIGEAT